MYTHTIGGVAEIYASKPNQHKIIFKNRKGICKLSLGEAYIYIV